MNPKCHRSGLWGQRKGAQVPHEWVNPGSGEALFFLAFVYWGKREQPLLNAKPISMPKHVYYIRLLLVLVSLLLLVLYQR